MAVLSEITSEIISDSKPSFETELSTIEAQVVSEPRDALEKIENLEALLDGTQNSAITFEVRFLKGKCFLQLGDLDTAQEQFDFCLSHAENSRNTLGKIKTLNYITKTQFRQNDFRQTLIYGNKALTLAKEIEAFQEQALASNAIGIAYGALYAFEEALSSFLEGLELKEHLDNDLIYKLTINTSSVYFYLNHYQQALDTLKEAFLYIDADSNPRDYLLAEENFCKIYTKLGDIDAANIHLEKAKEIAERYPEHSDLHPGLYETFANFHLSR